MTLWLGIVLIAAVALAYLGVWAVLVFNWDDPIWPIRLRHKRGNTR